MRGRLIIIAHASEWNANVWRDVAASEGMTLCLDGVVSQDLLPPGATTCMPDDLMDPEDVRRAFLEFLETWPQRASMSDKSLDELWTVDGRHSVWWTHVASHRQPDHGVFRYFRVAALIDRAIERFQPSVVWLLTRDSTVAMLVQSRASAAAIPVELAPGSATPLPVSSGAGGFDRLGWWCRSAAHALTYWLANIVPALRYRWALREKRRQSSRPTIAFACRFEGYLSLQNGRLSLLNWREISKALKEADPIVEQVFLPRALDRVVDTGDSTGRRWRGLEAARRARGPLVIHESFVPVLGQATPVWRQLVTSWRLLRSERTHRFSASFRFAGCDMSPLLLPQLKQAVAEIVDWSFKIGQLRCALRASGDVRVVIVGEEMYRSSMPILTAAAELGIPTVGVQHGNIMPAHLTYRIPRGHVRYAPVPNHFAVYGQYAKDVVAGLSAYPPSSVWITGAARLDSWVNRRMSKNEAQQGLGIPAGKRVVVLATQTFPWFTAAIREVLECVRARPDVVLCIKKHQSSRAMSADALRALAAEVGAPNVRVFECDLERLMFASDVWISASSTTILEATLIGTRSICLNFSGEHDRYPYVEDGASLPARSVAELAESLSRLLDGDTPASETRRLAFLTRHAGPTKDGHAATTLADHVIGLCHRSATRVRLPQPAA